MSETILLTPEGMEQLKLELHDLKSRGRAEIAEEIAEAREKGDLSENAEYDAAKDKQGLLELRISRLETQLANARIIDVSQMDLDKVNILATVKLKNLANNMELTYTLVSEREADVKSGKISTKTPVGAAILGKKVGEIAEAHVPAGVMKFEIVEISYNFIK